jgi:hypothetical protein
MRRVSKNVCAEIYFWGCNPRFVETSDSVVMNDSPQLSRAIIQTSASRPPEIAHDGGADAPQSA